MTRNPKAAREQRKRIRGPSRLLLGQLLKNIERLDGPVLLCEAQRTISEREAYQHHLKLPVARPKQVKRVCWQVTSSRTESDALENSFSAARWAPFLGAACHNCTDAQHQRIRAGPRAREGSGRHRGSNGASGKHAHAYRSALRGGVRWRLFDKS